MMSLSLQNIKNEDIQKKIISGIFLIAFGYSYVYFFIATSFIVLPGRGILYSTVLSILNAAVMAMSFFLQLKELYLIYKSDKKNKCETADALLKLFALIGTYIFWINKGSSDEVTGIMMMVMLGISSKEQKASSILRIAFMSGTIIVVVCFVLSMLGIITNHDGNSFGFVYRTDYACHLLFLMLIYCFYYGGNLPPAGELGILALFLYNLFFVGGKIADLCMFSVLIATYWRHYRKEGKIPFQNLSHGISIIFRIIYIPFSFADRLLRPIVTPHIKRIVRCLWLISFPTFAALMIAATVLFYLIPTSVVTAMPHLSTLWSRLTLGITGFDIYQVNLWGNCITSRGNGGATETVWFYYFLDSSYIKLLIEYGLVIFFIFLALFTMMQFRLFNKKQFYQMFLMTVVAMDCFMEHHLTDISYNIFGVIILSDLTAVAPKKSIWNSNSLKIPKKTKPGTFSPTKKKVFRIYILLSVLLAIPAIVSAYQITTWSGYTPQNGAVLILPGGYMEGDISTGLQEELSSKRVNCAISYLSHHGDAVCIISGTESERKNSKITLCRNGIDTDRIYIDEESDNLAAALSYADEVIENENLINRKTVCTFKIQQARVSQIAEENRTIVNALPVVLSQNEYYSCFVFEQIQLVKLWIGQLIK